MAGVVSSPDLDIERENIESSISRMIQKVPFPDFQSQILLREKFLKVII